MGRGPGDERYRAFPGFLSFTFFVHKKENFGVMSN